jgi:hypothetical protein
MSHFLVTMEALQHILIWSGVLPAYAESVVLMTKWSVMEMVSTDLARVPNLGSSDSQLLKLVCKEMARCAAASARDTDSNVATDKQLLAIYNTIKRVEDKIRAQEQSCLPPILNLPKSVSAIDSDHFFMGRLRRDTTVDHLIGDVPIPPILLPVQLTTMSEEVANNHDVAVAMRKCVELCALLDNQRDRVKNSYLHRAALIQHLFTRVVPIPLPHNHPQKMRRCFWAGQPMRYETQADILRSLDSLCRHYVAVSLSLNVTRSFDATRMLVIGCMTCIADAVVRMIACDYPSKFSRHYSGNMPGPVNRFGFEIGYYAYESETACFTSPELAAARTQILDYFHQQREFLTEENTIFCFEQKMSLSPGDHNMIDQVCLSMGFERSTQSQQGKIDTTFCCYLTNENRDLIDNYPEIASFRNIVYYFKAFMTPTADALPDVRRWRPKDAALSWQSNKNAFMHVAAFGQDLKCSAFMKPSNDAGVFSRFVSLFSSSNHPRVQPSGGDPSNLAESLIETEDDVLHVRHLPDFDGRLSARQSELLLQYLTVPYMRIPLVLQFFADQMRLTTLASEELQGALDACLFEPALWQSEHHKEAPDVIPPKANDHFATPCGLLFNELMKSPDLIVQAINNMLSYILEHDEGKFAPNSSRYILYVVRLVVRVESYMIFMIRHASARAASDQLNGSADNSLVRGLDCRSDRLRDIQHAQDLLRKRLTGQVHPLLMIWCRKCTDEKRVSEACILWAHMAYIFKGVTTEQLDEQAVTTILVAQMFLHNNYTFDAENLNEPGSRSKYQESANSNLGIPQTELFDLFQRNRNKMFVWLEQHPIQRDAIMETMIRVLTMTGWFDKVDGSKLSSRQWGTLEEEGYIGRYQPDTERIMKTTSESTNYEDWLRFTTTQVVETEINIQLGEFTLKKQQMQLVPERVYDNSDFEDVFGTVAKDIGMQCAVVQLTTNCEWLRLVGNRHDAQLWTADTRAPAHPFKRSYPGGLSATEQWVSQILSPLMQPYKTTSRISMQPADCSEANFARLTGYFFGKASSERYEPLREIVVIREPPAVHVYNVIEHGRRWYQQLVFVSLHCPQVACLTFFFRI